jgi:hypothetical protein
VFFIKNNGPPASALKAVEALSRNKADVVVLGLSVDDKDDGDEDAQTRSQISAFASRLGLSYSVAWDNGLELARIYQPHMTP